MSEETKALIEAATKELKDKNKELLTKLSKANTTLSKFEGVDLDALQTAATKLEEYETAQKEKEGKFETLYTELKNTATTTEEDYKSKLEKMETSLSETKKKNNITIGLLGLDIIPELLDIAVGTIMPEASFNDEGKVVFGDKDAKTFFAEWGETPVGKHFIKTGNTGGGADGNEGDLVSSYEKHFKPESVNMTKQLELKSKDKKAYDNFMKKYPRKPMIPGQG